MGLELSGEDVAALEARTEGWVAALQLAALSMTGREDVGGVRRAGSPATTGTSSTTSRTRSSPASPPRSARSCCETAVLDRLTGAAVRRRDRPGRRPGGPRGARARQPVPRRARRPAPLVPLPPPVRGRPAGEAPRRAADARARAARAGERLVRGARRPGRGDRARPGRGRLRAGGRPDRGRGARPARRRARSRRSGAGSTRSPTRCSSIGRSSPSAHVARPDVERDARGRRAAAGRCRALAAGRARRGRTCGGRRGGDDRPPHCRAQPPAERDRAAPGRPGPGARRLRRHDPTRERDDRVRGVRPAARAGRRVGLLALAYWSRGDLDAAHAAWSQAIVEPDRGRPRRRCARAARSGSRTSRSRRGDSATRATRTSAGSARARRRLEARCVAPRTCTSGWPSCTSSGTSSTRRVRTSTPPRRSGRRPACRRTRIGRGSRWRGCGRPRAGSTRRSSCSTRPSAATTPTSFRTSARSPRSARGRGSGRGGWPTPQRWVRDRGALAPTTTWRTCASSSTSRSRGCCSRRHARPAERRRRGVAAFLDRLLDAAEAGGRRRSQVEALALAALALRLAGDASRARPARAALALAEPEGFVRLFVDEGPPMLALLRERSSQRGRSAYVDRLIAAFGDAADAHRRSSR